MAEKTPPSRGIRLIYRILVGVVLAAALALLAGTFYALVLRNPGDLPPEDRPAQALATPEGRTFTNLGRIRTTTLPPRPAAVIVSITFPYDPEDRAFTEELASRIRDFRRTASEYLASFSAEELVSSEEQEIKEELLRRYNMLLRLGRIEILYFNDFMIIE